MVITHHGGQCFKVSFGDTTLAFDPIAKSSKLTGTKFGADVAFVSLNHPNFNGVDQAAHGAKEPFEVWGPGEYEFGEVTARGYGVLTNYDGAPHYNTIYQVRMEDINMIFMGALSSADIDSKILSEFGDVDILFVPVGGGDVLDVPAAAKLAVKLEAKLIIPMHYEKASLTAFLKEISAEGAEQVEKLTIKKKDVLEMEGEVVVLKVV
jgi:L-ascorbate metabolism protein UlaG (beta-lactamase superfamily)